MTRKNVNGKVISWKGTYGFIQIDGSSETVFVHESEVKGKGELSRGESVVFDIVPGKKGFKQLTCRCNKAVAFTTLTISCAGPLRQKKGRNWQGDRPPIY
ncbi:cold-shock protein [Geobacillus zalihae]|uniref:cold-shock protein n=1 Tax=Geobacillus zalihae TaxID=213419 RepID=UPI0016806577|nr:cold shock domain-containing protein [Geobacillus zalihae]